jgi:hypothetical protein
MSRSRSGVVKQIYDDVAGLADMKIEEFVRMMMNRWWVAERDARYLVAESLRKQLAKREKQGWAERGDPKIALDASHRDFLKRNPYYRLPPGWRKTDAA